MSEYDFIVVGAGPAGATLASRLAQSSSSLTVLLIEAGSANDDKAHRLLYDRYSTFITVPDYNWNYMTTPQPTLKNNQIFYARGKGLGGSSSINFCCYTIGPKDDFDEWARLVGDERYNWDQARRRFSELEAFHNPTSPEVRKYSDLADWHGKKGPVPVEFPSKNEISLAPSLEAIKEAGFQLNPDINSGDPIGVGVSPSTATKGIRITAASAFLEPQPGNLTIKTDAPIARVHLKGRRAIGVETISGEKCILLLQRNHPLLRLSGIGPEEELSRHEIPMHHPLPGVGRNLMDHCHFFFTVEQNPSVNERSPLFSNNKAIATARSQFTTDGSGPFSYMNHSLIMGFLKNPAMFSTPEFHSLPPHAQLHLQKPTVPTWELIADASVNYMFPTSDKSRTFFGAGAVLMNPQSRGTVTLASSNPQDAPVCDPKFFSHPFDRVNLIAAARKLLAIFDTPAIKTNTIRPAVYPKSDSDEDIWDALKDGVGSTWHMAGTCKMGVEDDEEAVVDSSFKVKGLEGLRVVDLSVLPLEPNCHTMSWAYLTGWTGAELLIKEYGFK